MKVDPDFLSKSELKIAVLGAAKSVRFVFTSVKLRPLVSEHLETFAVLFDGNCFHSASSISHVFLSFFSVNFLAAFYHGH